jgi:hypothetical protein
LVVNGRLSVSRIPSPPGTLDNKIHHNNLIQNILPRIQANKAGDADAIMLDVEGTWPRPTPTTYSWYVVAMEGWQSGNILPVPMAS